MPGNSLQRLPQAGQLRYRRGPDMLMCLLQFSHSGPHRFDLRGGFTLKLVRKLGNQGVDGVANASFLTALLGFDLPQISLDRRYVSI